MSQANVEIVIAAASGRLECWDPDAELTNFESAPYVKPYRGHSGLGDWYRDATEDVAQADVAVEDLTAVDEEQVVSSLRLTGRAKGSGMPVDIQLGIVWKVRDGKVIRAQGYRTRAEALEAADLRGGCAN